VDVVGLADREDVAEADLVAVEEAVAVVEGEDFKHRGILWPRDYFCMVYAICASSLVAVDESNEGEGKATKTSNWSTALTARSLVSKMRYE